MANEYFEAKIRHVNTVTTPDVYLASTALRPHNDFVVSRDYDGKPLSYYPDLAWNRTPYGISPDGAWLYFDYWRERNAAPNREIDRSKLTEDQEMRVQDIQWLMFILIYLREGNTLANSTLGRYSDLLCALASFSETLSISVGKLINSPILLKFAEKFPGQSTNLAALLKLLESLGPERTGYEIAPRAIQERIKNFIPNRKNYYSQTPPIPTRIYSAILSQLSIEVETFEKVMPRLLTLLERCSQNQQIGKSIHTQRNNGLLSRQAPQTTFEELLKELGLYDFWKERGLKVTRQSISGALVEAMGACYLQIQAYSGMRFNEAHSLPYFCLNEVVTNGIPNYIISGRVTKLTGGKIKRVRWVTSESGMRAVRLAQNISKKIYELAGNPVQESIDRINDYNLFVAPGYALHTIRGRQNKRPALDLSIATFDRLKRRLGVHITEADIEELETIDPDAHWGSKPKFQVGNTWPLKTHQLRRSLALYGHASGLISLPSLKRQLQHITQAMSQYYARGSEFSKNFISRTDQTLPHFGEEWQSSVAESEYLGHKLNVEMAEPDEVAGAYALWFDRNIRSKQISLDREKTLKEFKQGKRAYRETFVGGCVKLGNCEVNVSDYLNLHCLLKDCKNQVIKLPKFDKMIRIQSRAVNELQEKAPELPETRIEAETLRLMKERFDHLTKQKLKI